MRFRRMMILTWMLATALMIVSCDDEITGPEGDITAPQVTSAFPLPDATDVPVDAAMTITFNEPMAAMTPADLAGFVTLSHGTVTAAGWTTAKTLAVTHTDWPASTVITATFSAAFEDTAGNTLSGSYAYSFTTAAESVHRPTVVTTHPDAGDDHVWAGETIDIVFSETMDHGTATGNLTLSHGSVTGFNWPMPHILEIQHTDWPDDTEITVTLGAALANEAGETLGEDYVFSFTTDDNIVSLVQFLPDDGAVDVPLNIDIWLEFSRGMDETSLGGAITVSVPDKADLDFSLDGDWNSWNVQMNSQLPPSTVVTVTVGTGAEDVSGLPLDQEYQFSFTTGLDADLMAPQLLTTLPPGGSTVPVTTSSIQFTFSEPIDDMSLDPTLMSGQFYMNIWDGESEPQWNANHTTITVDLAAPLAPGTTYLLVFDSFADISGNVNTDGFEYEITIEGQPDYFPVVDGRWSMMSGFEQSSSSAKPAYYFHDVRQLEVTGAPGDFLIKDWDAWQGAFLDWEMYTRNQDGILFRGFHETDDEDKATSSEIIFSPAIEWMRFPTVVENWAGTSMFLDPEPGGPDRVVYSIEYLSGTFDVMVEADGEPDILWMDCRKAALNYSITDGVTPFSTGVDTLWYAPGAGLAREVSREEDSESRVRTSESNLVWVGSRMPSGN